MRLDNVFVQGRRTWVRLHEKGGKEHAMPCHHNLGEYLLAGAKDWLFRSGKDRTEQFSDQPLSQAAVYRMIGRRAKAAGIRAKIGCHAFRATGITEYLKNSGRLEATQQMANYESAITTGLYDRYNDQVSLDEINRIAA